MCHDYLVGFGHLDCSYVSFTFSYKATKSILNIYQQLSTMGVFIPEWFVFSFIMPCVTYDHVIFVHTFVGIAMTTPRGLVIFFLSISPCPLWCPYLFSSFCVVRLTWSDGQYYHGYVSTAICCLVPEAAAFPF